MIVVVILCLLTLAFLAQSVALATYTQLFLCSMSQGTDAATVSSAKGSLRFRLCKFGGFAPSWRSRKRRRPGSLSRYGFCASI